MTWCMSGVDIPSLVKVIMEIALFGVIGRKTCKYF